MVCVMHASSVSNMAQKFHYHQLGQLCSSCHYNLSNIFFYLKVLPTTLASFADNNLAYFIHFMLCLFFGKLWIWSRCNETVSVVARTFWDLRSCLSWAISDPVSTYKSKRNSLKSPRCFTDSLSAHSLFYMNKKVEVLESGIISFMKVRVFLWCRCVVYWGPSRWVSRPRLEGPLQQMQPWFYISKVV